MSSTVSLLHPGTRPVEPALRVLAARPDLRPGTSAFRAAVVLLAGPQYAFNIDRIAGRCGLPRAFVAASARRLIDNGVWAGGTATYPWSGPDDPRFWNDAAVAEGRLLRRARSVGGVEWAPAGTWEKAFDYVGPQSDPGGAVLYLDAAPAAPPTRHPHSTESGGTTEPPDAARGGIPPVGPEGAVLHGAAWFSAQGFPGEWLGEPGTDGNADVASGGAARLPELFPGADWLA